MSSACFNTFKWWLIVGAVNSNAPVRSHTHASPPSWQAIEENDTSCCYALQDKVWVHDPGAEPWEVYVVKADADTLGKSQDGLPEAACRTPAGQANEGDEPAASATAGGCC